MLDDLKVLLNLTDTSKDELLNTLISLKGRKLSNALGGVIVPIELEYIITELVINHYNRLGNEGIAATSVEGISTNYIDSTNELEPYNEVIAKYLNENKGKFRFL